uniref:Adrenomedullin 2 n=1 Tax=Hippocampus comes TaxID=109280 RepID=A0A3Q2YNY2_HIPCM
MCALLPAWTCLLFGLLPLEIQTRAQLSQNVQKNRFIWRVLRTKEPSPRWFEMEQEAWPSARGRSRGRRHAKSRRTHRQMMRAGCVLGTCQVQNLSHRLYQLIGRRGRHDSSPIDPRSPHSYG